jgi:hypothetical protein
MSSITDPVKRALIHMNRFMGALERRNIVTYRDIVRWRAPRYNRPILFGQEGHDRIGELVACGNPLMIARLGATELSCIRFFLEKRKGGKRGYSRQVRYDMPNLSGFFPADDASLDRFSVMFLEQLKQVDLLAVWFNTYEETICNERCPQAELVELWSLEPFRFANPWSRRLAGKKVLVVHPFAESIRKQYAEKRRLLFPSPDVLPDFQLKTIKAVQSIAGSPVNFASWFDAYRHMCDEIAATDFDICLIGAGAYGLSLAAFAKGLGKQAIHMGGVTQILFGIKGRRWEREFADTTAKLFNEHWIRPEECETPANKDIVEDGCYW